MTIKTFEELKETCIKNNTEIWQTAQLQEAQIHDITVEEFRARVNKTLSAMKEAIKNGMESSVLTNGKMGGFDCAKQKEYYKNNPCIYGKLYEKILCYSLATSEENARMGRIAACPTAGACGIVPSVIISMGEIYNIDNEKLINSLIIAGITGQIISFKVKPSGATAGCQAECGSASAMAAAAMAYLFDCDTDKILNSSALALKNILGLTCDPVRGFVEVPCIKRNPFMALHAASAVEMAKAGIVSVIPIDDIVDAMEQTGALMSSDLKESSRAGLAKTKTAIVMEKACFTKKYYSALKE